jgi:hypothetical protein
MEFSTELMANRDDRTVDVSDQAVAKNDVRDFPVATFPDVRQPLKTGNTRGFASRVPVERLVHELR